ncbi:hypothetical protein P4H70_26515 [Paenibacillus ehimensis]|uniref:DUF4367 domain-containing protein n=1 Tax=Paenibacillus ehimensis TaxID=79264 RepID=UPI002DB7F10A|nr:DUF4367 domain-containing protein [Paenibacillus ehimensis]MEC0212489.1 hypothetical protein [Paenibacillus ehimensis]
MSIENHLKTELQHFAGTLHAPAQLDERIGAFIRKHTRTSAPSSRPVKRQYAIRAALIAACIFLFSGIAYASSLLYTMQTDKVRVELTQQAAASLPASLSAELTQSVRDIRSELASGESAYVYSAELEKRKLPALLKITAPAAYTDIEAWKTETKRRFAPFKAPTALPAGFAFVRGELEAPVGGIDAAAYEQYHSLLRKKALAGNRTIVWQKAPAASAAVSPMDMPGLVYANGEGEQIEVRYQVFPGDDAVTDIRTITGESTTAEKVSVSGKDGYYTLNRNHILSETGAMQSLVWLEAQDGSTILYQVTTPSLNVSQDDLLRIANSLQ